MGSLDSEGGRLEMEVKISCSNCGRDLRTSCNVSYSDDTQTEDIRLEIYKCEKCCKIAYEKGWQEGVAKYLNQKGE